MITFLSALLLAIVLEGLLYAAFPEQMKRALIQVLNTPTSQLRVVALTLAVIALILLYIVRGFA